MLEKSLLFQDRVLPDQLPTFAAWAETETTKAAVTNRGIFISTSFDSHQDNGRSYPKRLFAPRHGI
ncbi:hypothetical protein CKO22_03630 [Thiococcus pfennigii]|nr:hypothetical protein [Thiococcus pfennigii]